jgi:hypothetical protein
MAMGTCHTHSSEWRVYGTVVGGGLGWSLAGWFPFFGVELTWLWGGITGAGV